MLKNLEIRRETVNSPQTMSSSRCSRQCLALLLVLLIGACGLAVDNEARLERGETAFANQDYRAAIVDAKEVLREEPRNIRGRLLLGRASLEIGDGAAAEKELRRAVELGANAPDSYVPIARAMLLQGKFEEVDRELNLADVPAADKIEATGIRADVLMAKSQPAAARKLYESVLKSEADNVDAQLGVASSYFAEGNLSQARSVLDHIIGNYPGDMEGWLTSGSLNLATANYSAAEENFRVALRLAGEREDATAELRAMGALAESLFAQNEQEEAKELVARMLMLAPDSLQARLLGARVSILNEDWKVAQQTLQAILQVVPNHPGAMMMIGATHLQSGNLVQAESYLAALVAASPQNADARHLLAETRLQMRKNDEAQEVLQPLLSGSNTESRFLSMAARASFGQGDFDEAIAYLRRNLEANPTDVDLRFQLATALLSANRPGEVGAVLAEIDVEGSQKNRYRRDVMSVIATISGGDTEQGLESAQLVVEKWPDEFGAHNLLGSIYLSTQDFVSARSSLERAAELSPDNMTSTRYLAATDEAENKLDSARSRYMTVLDEDPAATWAMFALARIDLRSENVAGATEWLEKMRAADATTIPPRGILSGLYASAGNFQAAKDVTLEALALDDSSAELYSLLGRAQQGLTDYREAVASFQRALGIDPSRDAYRLNLANALRLSGDNASARRVLESREGDILDNLPSAVAYVGILLDEGDSDDAMQVAKRLQQRYPDSAVPHALEAEVHARNNNMGMAADSYDRALAIDVIRSHAIRANRIKIELGNKDAGDPLIAYLDRRPLDSEVRLVLAETYQQFGRAGDAVVEYERVVSESPDNAVALNNLAWIYYLEKDERAEATARRAHELLPENAAIADTLGWILVETGSLADGVAVLRRAAELSNGRAEIRYHLAVALDRIDSTREAKRILQDIVSGDEEFTSRADAEQLLATL
jgi:putative PEP-CTERM system TPR-repeat lipoprotein